LPDGLSIHFSVWKQCFKTSLYMFGDIFSTHWLSSNSYQQNIAPAALQKLWPDVSNVLME
jgi:hypothetical protein